jgi:hypothetical protein
LLNAGSSLPLAAGFSFTVVAFFFAVALFFAAGCDCGGSFTCSTVGVQDQG